MNLRTLAAMLLAVLTTQQLAHADLVIDDWDNDNLSTSNGIVDINADGVNSVTKTITNTTTFESVMVTVKANPNASLLSEGGPAGNFLGIDSAGGDNNDFLDAGGSDGVEWLTFTFDTPVIVNYLSFGSLDWNTNGAGQADDTFELVEVLVGGTLVNTLFSSDADQTHTGFTGATGPIAGTFLSPDGDEFTSLNLNVGAGTELVLRFGADPATLTTTLGYQLDNIGLAAIPEPSAFLFGGLLCGAVGLISSARRFFRRAG